ncbi:hypothetical protein AB4Z54_25490 [Streptomyces sp. MCAF7]
MSSEKRGLVGVSALGSWTAEQSQAYTNAREVINQVIAAYSARIGSGSDAETDALVAEQLQYTEELQRLSVFDQEDIQRVLREYPGVIRRLNEDAR